MTCHDLIQQHCIDKTDCGKTPVHGWKPFGLLHPGVNILSKGHCASVSPHKLSRTLFLQPMQNSSRSSLKDFLHLNHLLILGNTVFKNRFTVFQPLIRHQSLSL